MKLLLIFLMVFSIAGCFPKNSTDSEKIENDRDTVLSDSDQSEPDEDSDQDEKEESDTEKTNDGDDGDVSPDQDAEEADEDEETDGDDEPQVEKRIYIASYNVENLYDTECDRYEDGRCRDGEVFTDYQFKQKISSIASAIRKIDADIMILTEIEDETSLQVLLDELKPKFNAFHIKDYSYYTDVAVMTRGTIDKVVYHGGYISDGKSWSREFPEVHITIDGRKAIVFAAHYKSKSNDDPERRLLEAQESYKILERVSKNNPNALIVMGGDLNDEPGSDPLDALETPNDPTPLLYRVLNDLPSYEQCTHNYGGCSKIDHILVSNNAGGSYVKNSVEIVKDGGCGRGEYCLGDSDHASVKAQFILP